MPNWIHNTLHVYGDNNDIKIFLNAITNDGSVKHTEDKEWIMFDKLISSPEGMTETNDWCIENWGTKWTERNLYVNYLQNKINMTFDTAWNAAIPAHKKIAKMFPKLLFVLSYIEEFMENNGVAILYNDICVEKEISSMNIDDINNFKNLTCEQVSECMDIQAEFIKKDINTSITIILKHLENAIPKNILEYYD